MFRWRQPTVVTPRPPPASFDATHPHGSLFYFHFSRRERAATKVVALARNGPLSTQNEKRSARCHCKRRRVSYPARGARPLSILPSSDRTKPLLCASKNAWFLVLRAALFTECPSVARRDLGRSASNSTTQASPHPGGANKNRRCPKRPAGARGANERAQQLGYYNSNVQL